MNNKTHANSTENMISIGIIYQQSPKCPDAVKRFECLKNFDQPTHFIQVPKECSLTLLKKVLADKFLSCTFDETKQNGFSLNLQFKCVLPLFENECSDDPFEFFQHTMIAENNDKIRPDEWIEIPDDYAKLQHPIINHPFIRIDTKNDFILVKQRQNVQQIGDLEIADVNIGDIIDAMDQQNKWYQAIVINKYFERVYLHFIGWSSRWNEWISNRKRISTRFSCSTGPHCTTLVNVHEAREKNLVAKCKVTAANTFNTMFNLDFSSLITEMHHREITLTTYDGAECEQLEEETEIKVHRCVLCLWSPSLAVLCQKNYGMKDCDSGIISLPTRDQKLVKFLAKWFYLSPAARLKVDESSIFILDMMQLMDLYTISEMHCIEELTFIVMQAMTMKMKQFPNVILYDMLKIKHFITIRMNRDNDYHTNCMFNQLYASFMTAVRSMELIDIKIILLNSNNKQSFGIDDDEKCEDEKKEDDICWVLTNIGYEDTFDEWFVFVIKWIFMESSNDWFDTFAANDNWKRLLNDWWIFVEKRSNQTIIEISSTSVKNVKQNIHSLYDKLDADRLSENTKSDLFEWLLSLIITQWDSALKKNN